MIGELPACLTTARQRAWPGDVGLSGIAAALAVAIVLTVYFPQRIPDGA